MKSDVEQWLATGKYLPEFMRDFHDQKDVFRTIHGRIKPEPDISWITGQCYVVDVFLHFMARRGYTLQKNRSNVAFRDIHEDVENHVAKEYAHVASLMEFK
jgi:hypothetical protein